MQHRSLNQILSHVSFEAATMVVYTPTHAFWASIALNRFAQNENDGVTNLSFTKAHCRISGRKFVVEFVA